MIKKNLSREKDLQQAKIWYALDFILVLMIIGPILGPLFHASGIWLLDQIAHWIIYPLGVWICPQDQHAIPIMGHAMTVCTRCYAAIGGLFSVRLALTSDPSKKGLGSWLARIWRQLSNKEQFIFIMSVITLWQLDIWAERLGWWSWGQGMLIATGPLVGLAIGFLFYGVAARLTGLRAAWN